MADAAPSPGGYQPGSRRQRVVSALLAAAVVVIALLLALLTGTVTVPKFGDGHALVSFDVGREDAAKSRAKTRPAPSRRAVEHRQPPAVGQVKPRLTVVKPRRDNSFAAGIPGFIAMSGSDLASADIGQMHGHASSSAGGDAGKRQGPGEGPGGVHLYNADWYRRPTDAQLGGYLKPSMPPSGYGTVACQTIEHYHVDNCQIIDEQPLGSGFGRAVQNAAWQFLVIPPRVDSRTEVGAWVRIRITYSARGGDPG